MTSKLKLIECTRGYTETSLGGQAYVFARDAFGRFTSDVTNLVHRALFLGVVHYREVEIIPPEMDSQLDKLEYDNPEDELGDGDDADDESEGEGDPDAETDKEDAGEQNEPPATVEPETPETPPAGPSVVEPVVPAEPIEPAQSDEPEAPADEAPAEPVTPVVPETPEVSEAPAEPAAAPAPAKRNGKKAS